MTRPLVKICGVTRIEDAERAVALGATHLGLNFHPPSPRSLEAERARRIADQVRGRAEIVGVFVDRSREEVEELGERVGLDLFQFHGHETAEVIQPLADRAIKVFRLDDSWSASELEGFDEVWGFLIEGRHPSLFGGTGESWGYERISAIDFGRPVLIAGGIRPGNVRQALSASGASGVDVCSGVESGPGVKDERLLRRLFAELRIANPDL